jgi:RNA polymerase sigma factor (sigma-70 family)
VRRELLTSPEQSMLAVAPEPTIAVNPDPICVFGARPDLPDITRRQMKFRTERIARLFALPTDQIADLWQELAADILRAMRRFDPLIASRTTFMKGVMNLWYQQKCKHLRREAASRGRVVVFPGSGVDDIECADYRSSGIAQMDLHIDLSELMADLPPDQYSLARDLLAGKTVPEIAAERGLHRGTVHRQVRQLRGAFESMDPKCR